jgi:hypothetical protein
MTRRVVLTVAAITALTFSVACGAPTPPPNADCTSDRQGSLGFSDPGIVNSNGFNTYVENNMWGANPGTTQTVCASSPHSWKLSVDAVPPGSTGVQTYPSVKQLMNNWTGTSWGVCATSNCGDTPVSGLSSLRSTFAITDPPTNQGVWEAAYDLWTSSGELMIWTTYSDARLADNGATIENPDVEIGGLHYTDMNYQDGLPQMVLHGNPSSGSIDILGVLHYWQSQGELAADATIGELDYGWEICSTQGTQDFVVTGYTLSGS